MSARKLSHNEQRVFNLLSDGMSVSAVARRLKMPYSSTNDITHRLEYYGVIRRVPGTKSPALYEPTEDSKEVRAETKEQSPKGDCGTEIRYPLGGATFCPTPSSDSVIVGMQPESERLAVLGVYRGDEPPEGFGRIHIGGGIYFEIRKVGTFDPLKDSKGLYIGYWNQPVRINGAWSTSGAVRVFGQESTFRFQQGDKGKNSFEYHPAKGIYVDPNHFRDSNDAAALLIRDSVYVTDVLRQTGWQLTNPVIKGKLHLAWPDHPLIQHVNPNVTYENGDIVVDCSPGRPEMEMEHIETPEDWKKAQLMAEFPTRFLGMEATVLADRRTLNETRESIKQSDAELREAISHNARALETLGVDVDQIISVLERADQALLVATSALSHIAEHSALLIQINSNLTKLHSDDAQRRLDSFAVQPQGAGRADQDSTIQSKPSKFPLEGYQ